MKYSSGCEICDLLILGDTRGALYVLLSKTKDSGRFTEVINLNARFELYQKGVRSGIITFDQYAIAIGQINDAILQLISIDDFNKPASGLL